MRYLKLILSYDGTRYEGWQFQPDKPTLQGTLEDALRRLTGQFTRVTGSSRTDAGVHARGQVVSFRTESRLTANDFRRGLNALLPPDMLVVEATDAPDGFHAIRDTVSKRYCYVIHNHPLRDVFSPRHAWHVWHSLDVAAMDAASRQLLGRHDFAAFQTSGSERLSTMRTVLDIGVRRESATRVLFEITADGFLYNMVRTIAGSLVLIGRGKQPVAWLADVLRSGDRTLAGATAPPHGLFLMSVTTGDPAAREPDFDSRGTSFNAQPEAPAFAAKKPVPPAGR